VVVVLVALLLALVATIAPTPAASRHPAAQRAMTETGQSLIALHLAPALHRPRRWSMASIRVLRCVIHIDSI